IIINMLHQYSAILIACDQIFFTYGRYNNTLIYRYFLILVQALGKNTGIQGAAILPTRRHT
ncbi:MAG: hypothetical protein PHI97_05175, partial [Desulfobulbus sp.]|nr:hypothetical protein [Desulfobulbus sp.]